MRLRSSLSALLGWQLNLTIWLAGCLVIIYTVIGGTKIVSITQRYQMIVILIGDCICGRGLPLVAGSVVSTRCRSPAKWANWKRSISGRPAQAIYVLVWADRRLFLALSYFGADQSQVQRYLAGGSLKRESPRLLFNAVVKGAEAVFIRPPARWYSCFTNSKNRRLISINQRATTRDGERLCATVNGVADAIR